MRIHTATGKRILQTSKLPCFTDRRIIHYVSKTRQLWQALLWFLQARTNFDNFGWTAYYSVIKAITFRNDMHIQLSLPLHFHLLNLRHQRLEAAPHWHIGKHITKRHRRSRWSVQKAVTCMREGERTSLWVWTSAKLLPDRFRATNSLPRKTRYVSRHFRRSHLKANKVSNNKGTKKVEYAYHLANRLSI